MWLATQYGFYSIVKKGPEAFHVRARVRKDLENLLELLGCGIEIQTWEGADYRYRIIVDQRTFSQLMARIALSIDYPNFKDQIAQLPDQQPKLDAFHRIWSVMAQLQH